MPPKRQGERDARDLVREAAELKADRIDELYGLEPVFEPEAAGGEPEQRAFAEIQCPSCGEILGLLINLSPGDHDYIEDCQICCRPMLVSVKAEDGRLASVSATTTD